MKKQLVTVVSLVLFAAPVFASAQTVSSNTDQLIAIYTQIIALLKQELALLQQGQTTVPAPSGATVTFEPQSGNAPFTTVFTVHNGSGTETLVFGDGYWNGSGGCTKNTLGFCDLSQPIAHTYKYPGSYNVLLYSHIKNISALLASTTLTVKPFVQ